MYSNSRMKLSALKKLLFTLALICFSFGTIDAQATCGGTGSSASNPFDNPIGCTWTNFTSPLTNYAVSNEGIINGTVNSTTNGAINNTGTISSISNSGTISANGLSANGILNNNLITNIINTDTGTISGGGAVILLVMVMEFIMLVEQSTLSPILELFQVQKMEFVMLPLLLPP